MSAPSNAPPPEQESADAVPGEGEILAGKYRIEKVLGQGGMGVVVAAQHTTLRQRVAVKFLLPEAAKREDATERFLREARAAVSIQSEHVARVMDVGTLDTGSPYMVMELLTGSDLGAELAGRGPFPIAEAVDYVLQACEAIAEAHSIGIIHRDLKPPNLFLSQRADGSSLIKVLDFGLSKVTKPDALDASLTAANVVMGSPCYMSPEQIKSLKGLDARTDIWALGVILYQLLTGVRPFEAPSLGALFFTIGADPPVPLRQRRPEIPPGLEAAVLKCLEKDSHRRTQTIAELARSLAPFAPEDSRISVERIHRVLSDGTPLPARRASVSDGTEDAIALNTAALEVVIDNDPTVAQPQVSPATAAPATALMAPPEPARIAHAVSAPVTMGETPKPPARPVTTGVPDPGKSGSMAAIAKEGAGASVPPPRAGNGRSGGLVAAVVVAAVVLVGGVTAFGLRGSTPATAANPAPETPAIQAVTTPPETPKPAETAAAVDTATANGGPTPLASTTAVAAASATASATASVAAGPKPPTPRATKGPATTKKPKDVYDKWK